MVDLYWGLKYNICIIAQFDIKLGSFCFKSASEHVGQEREEDPLHKQPIYKFGFFYHKQGIIFEVLADHFNQNSVGVLRPLLPGPEAIIQLFFLAKPDLVILDAFKMTYVKVLFNPLLFVIIHVL